ncbi:MAG: hypothetical protein ACO2YV_13445, partial [Pseudomonadales bacterium]
HAVLDPVLLAGGRTVALEPDGTVSPDRLAAVLDAWRLAQWQRYAPPGLPFPGLTGQLAQAADQRWVRTLRLATIERGALSPAPVRFALPAP